MIERVERFVTDGKEFKSLQKAIDHREGLIEQFLRALPGFDGIRAKDRIPFIQTIIDKKKQLRELLNYEVPPQ